MTVWYFDNETGKIEELACTSVTVGVEYATVCDYNAHYKLIPIQKLLYILSDN